MPTWMRWTCAAATVAFLLAFVAVNVKRRWSVQENPEQHPAIAFLNKHNIHKTTILVADRPGFLAFDSDNYIVCADMLTGNRPLLDKMRAGANGAQVLMDHCAAQGRPIEYVIVFGIPFLELSKDERTIALLDPKTFPDRAVIGEIQLTTPKIPTAGEVPGGERIKVWKMPAKAVSGS